MFCQQDLPILMYESSETESAYSRSLTTYSVIIVLLQNYKNNVLTGTINPCQVSMLDSST